MISKLKVNWKTSEMKLDPQDLTDADPRIPEVKYQPKPVKKFSPLNTNLNCQLMRDY